MIFTPIKTKKLIPPKDNLDKLLNPILLKLKENMIVVITSKVISIVEGNCIKIDEVKDKDALIKQEADLYLERENVPGGWLMHTLKNGTLIPTAGIDESNSNGYFILWPKNPEKSAQKIWKYLKEKTNVNNLGVIISDSHSEPLRRGLVGLSIAHFGFKPLHDYRGKEDLFGRELKVSLSNIPDSLASGSVMLMGEGSEQTPIVLITDLPKSVEFIQKKYSTKKPFSSFQGPLEEDLFKPFLTNVPWKKDFKKN
jgi:dihydrofolate synthase / folylpolyglutamate synthase